MWGRNSNWEEVHSSQGVQDIGCVVKWGIFKKDCKQKKDGEDKGKENDSAYITESDRSDALILSLAESSDL